MDTLAIALAAPLLGLLISLKTTQKITKDQDRRITKLEEQSLTYKGITSDLAKKQQSYLSLNERVGFIEATVDNMDNRQALNMVRLMEPVTQKVTELQRSIGIS